MTPPVLRTVPVIKARWRRASDRLKQCTQLIDAGYTQRAGESEIFARLRTLLVFGLSPLGYETQDPHQLL